MTLNINYQSSVAVKENVHEAKSNSIVFHHVMCTDVVSSISAIDALATVIYFDAHNSRAFAPRGICRS